MGSSVERLFHLAWHCMQQSETAWQSLRSYCCCFLIMHCSEPIWAYFSLSLRHLLFILLFAVYCSNWLTQFQPIDRRLLSSPPIRSCVPPPRDLVSSWRENSTRSASKIRCSQSKLLVMHFMYSIHIYSGYTYMYVLCRDDESTVKRN